MKRFQKSTAIYTLPIRDKQHNGIHCKTGKLLNWFSHTFHRVIQFTLNAYFRVCASFCTNIRIHLNGSQSDRKKENAYFCHFFLLNLFKLKCNGVIRLKTPHEYFTLVRLSNDFTNAVETWLFMSPFFFSSEIISFYGILHDFIAFSCCLTRNCWHFMHIMCCCCHLKITQSFPSLLHCAHFWLNDGNNVLAKRNSVSFRKLMKILLQVFRIELLSVNNHETIATG